LQLASTAAGSLQRNKQSNEQAWNQYSDIVVGAVYAANVRDYGQKVGRMSDLRLAAACSWLELLPAACRKQAKQQAWHHLVGTNLDAIDVSYVT
jgi:hypothetical protein